MQDYHNLDIWRRSHALALKVRRATNSFPRTGFAEMKAQMTDSAESIPYNIVEVCGASTRKEFARFIQIAIKSSCELEYQLELARDNGVLSRRDWRALAGETVEIRRMMCGFRKTLLDAGDD